MALLGFIGGEAGVVGLSLLLVLALAWRGRRPSPTLALAGTPDAFDRRFVAAMALGPFALLLAGAVVSGFEFRVHWGFALWSLLGLFAVLFLAPSATPAGLRRLAVAWAALFVAAAAAYAALNGVAPYAGRLLAARADPAAPARHLLRRLQGEGGFPAPELAAFATGEWQRRTGTRLAYVIGNKWVAGNLAFFSPDHPLVLRDGDAAASPWIDMRALRRQGALLVWDSTRDDGRLTGVLARRFPGMELQAPLLLPWANGAHLQPMRLSWAILYPEGSRVPALPGT